MPIDHPRGAREMARAGHDVGKLVLDAQVFVRCNKTIIFD